MIWKCAPTPFYSSPHYLAGVWWGLSREPANPNPAAGRERRCFGGWVSVPPMATVRQCCAADSRCLRSGQFPGEGAARGGERCRAPQPLTLRTLAPQREAEKLVPLLSHLAPASERRVLLGAASLLPLALDLITRAGGSGALVMGARFFLETQSTRGGEQGEGTRGLYRPSCPPCVSPQGRKHSSPSVRCSPQLPLC